MGFNFTAGLFLVKFLPLVKNHSGDLDVDGNIILQWMFLVLILFIS